MSVRNINHIRGRSQTHFLSGRPGIDEDQFKSIEPIHNTNFLNSKLEENKDSTRIYNRSLLPMSAHKLDLDF